MAPSFNNLTEHDFPEEDDDDDEEEEIDFSGKVDF